MYLAMNINIKERLILKLTH